MATAPDCVKKLVDRFHAQEDEVTNPNYNETQLRIDYINPLFAALGWDLGNSQRFAEQFREVVHEDRILVAGVGGGTKAPDYSFRIGGHRKFFLEAKKPSVNISKNPDPAYQLRRYGWSAKLAVSILTDFEEFAVYDCRFAPKHLEQASTARREYLLYTQYLDRWDFLEGTFSKSAVLRGDFDRYCATKKGKGAEEFDEAFLEEIEEWRKKLAQNLAMRNEKLDQQSVNFAVQRIIDRIIFLRICEDRGIETFGQLKELLDGDDTYSRLRKLFTNADARYNSGLFHFESEKSRKEMPDTITPALEIDDKTLKDILRRLYYPESPYVFSVVSADILGSVYERFLGKVITLTAGHHAKIENKPEVRKAGGVYYTPTYIVEYIIEHTLGKLLHPIAEEKPEESSPLGLPPRDASKLKILDPACGSGSFLIRAYQYLLDHHLNWYLSNNPEKFAAGKNAPLRPAPDGTGSGYRLTIKTRKQILLDNIFGVDLDHQAVEVTKLSLLLKCLEGETSETLAPLTLFRERALPDLGNNIKCGNSLIGTDIINTDKWAQMDAAERTRVNPFDYQLGFPSVFKRSGFDAVIGNPPWISLTGRFGNDICSPAALAYLTKVHQGNTYMPNMYEYFISAGLHMVCNRGYFSFIVPDRFANNAQFAPLRKRIVDTWTIVEAIHKFPFPGITADTLVFIFNRKKPSPSHSINIARYGTAKQLKNQVALSKEAGCDLSYFENESEKAFVNARLKSPLVTPLSQLCRTTSGFGGKSQLVTRDRTSQKQIACLKGDSILRYGFRWSYWFDFIPENITGRTTDKAKLGSVPKILLRKTGDEIIATYDDSGMFPEQSLYFLYDFDKSCDPKYVLGVLNSAVLNYFYKAHCLTNKDSIAQVKKVDLDQLPFPKPDGNPELVDRVAKLVEIILGLKKSLIVTKLPQAKEQINRQLEATDREIDLHVFSLYGLSAQEVDLITSSSSALVSADDVTE